MIDETAIAFLVGRIGFGVPETDIIGSVTVSPDNITGTSGRTFNYFHKLVTLGNIYDTTNEISMQDEAFNEYLRQIKYDAAKSVFAVLSSHTNKSCPDINYSDLVLSNPELFEDAYGYAVAYSCVEQMIATTRSNNKERNAKLAYQQLKVELEGARNDNGFYIASGISNKMAAAIKNITELLCPNELRIYNANCW